MKPLSVEDAMRKMHRRAFWWGFFHPLIGRERQLEYARFLAAELHDAYPELDRRIV